VGRATRPLIGLRSSARRSARDPSSPPAGKARHANDLDRWIERVLVAERLDAIFA